MSDRQICLEIQLLLCIRLGDIIWPEHGESLLCSEPDADDTAAEEVTAEALYGSANAHHPDHDASNAELAKDEDEQGADIPDHDFTALADLAGPEDEEEDFLAVEASQEQMDKDAWLREHMIDMIADQSSFQTFIPCPLARPIVLLHAILRFCQSFRFASLRPPLPLCVRPPTKCIVVSGSMFLFSRLSKRVSFARSRVRSYSCGTFW